MVSRTLIIGIVGVFVSIFLAGFGIGYAVFHSDTTAVPKTMTPQQMTQMMNDPKQITAWNQYMNNNPQEMDQLHQAMMNNPTMMNSTISAMMNNQQFMSSWNQYMNNNPQAMDQWMNSMMRNQYLMQQMMNNSQFQNHWMNQNMNMMNSPMMERGNIAMGFNQTKIMHHFVTTATGGEIMIKAVDMQDAKTISEIRDHIKEIQTEFAQGNFTKPFFIHDQVVPGTEIMSAKKDSIQYFTKQTKDGGVLVLTTDDPKVLDAIKQFMDFQSSQHMNN